MFFISPRNQASGTFCCDHGSLTEIPVTQRAFPSGPAIRENFPQHPGHSRPAGCWTLDTRSLPRSPCCSALFSSLSSTGENSVLFRDSGGFVALVLFSYKTVLNFVFKYWAKQKKKSDHILRTEPTAMTVKNQLGGVWCHLWGSACPVWEKIVSKGKSVATAVSRPSPSPAGLDWALAWTPTDQSQWVISSYNSLIRTRLGTAEGEKTGSRLFWISANRQLSSALERYSPRLTEILDLYLKLQQWAADSSFTP